MPGAARAGVKVTVARISFLYVDYWARFEDMATMFSFQTITFSLD